MDVLKEKVVVTRKAHVCSGCAETYAKGTTMACTVGADSGDIYSAYWCETCDYIIRTTYDVYDQANGILHGEVKEADEEFWEETRKKLKAKKLI